MEVQKVVLIDYNTKAEALLNHNYPVKDRKIYSGNKYIKLKPILPIQVNNDSFMIKEQYRNPELLIDRSIFIKSDYEKQQLKKIKSNIKSTVKKDNEINNYNTSLELAKAFAKNTENNLSHNISCFVSPFTPKQNGLQKN